MDCKKVRELILMDYLDGEANDGLRSQINIHFARCHSCREFSFLAKDNLLKPFNNISKAKLPESVWQRIKEEIESEQAKKRSCTLKFYFSKPAFAITTVALLLIIIGAMAKLRVNNQVLLQIVAQSQAGYSFYSVDPAIGFLMNENTGFGTSIEEHFL